MNKIISLGLDKKIELDEKGVVGVWKVEEEASFFEDGLILFPAEEAEIDQLSKRKRNEWMASRYLLHHLSGRIKRAPCLKDQFGKPYLQDSKYAISMSHSHDYVAVMAHRRSCGVDIQVPVNKITRISKKFCSFQELAYIPEAETLNFLHVIWGAKESMYKAYGRKGLDFKKDMEVHRFAIDKGGDVVTSATLTITDRQYEYIIHAQVSPEYILVYAVQSVGFHRSDNNSMPQQSI